MSHNCCLPTVFNVPRLSVAFPLFSLSHNCLLPSHCFHCPITVCLLPSHCFHCPMTVCCLPTVFTVPQLSVAFPLFSLSHDCLLPSHCFHCPTTVCCLPIVFTVPQLSVAFPLFSVLLSFNRCQLKTSGPNFCSFVMFCYNNLHFNIFVCKLN